MWQHSNPKTSRRMGLTHLILLVFHKVEEISAAAGCYMEAFLAPVFSPLYMAG